METRLIPHKKHLIADVTNCELCLQEKFAFASFKAVVIRRFL